MLIEIVISRRAHDDDDDVTVECYSTTTTVSTVVPRVSCSRGLARGVVKFSREKISGKSASLEKISHSKSLMNL
jgi:hypothetical protein